MSSMETSLPVSSEEKGYKNGGAVAAKPAHSAAVTVLRLLTFAATLSAFVAMITDKQSRTVNTPLGRLKLWAKYHYSDAFMWFVIANGIGFVYALVATLLGTVAHPPALAKLLLTTDLLVASILMSGAAAATAVAYIGKRGIVETNWSEICNTFEKYCHHILGALVAGFLGWLFLTIAVVIGLQRRH